MKSKFKFKKNFTKNLTIRGRLFLGFGIVTAIIVILGIYSILAIGNVNGSTKVLAETCLPGVNYAHFINTDAAEYRVYELRHVLATDTSEMAEIEENMDKIEKEIEEYFVKYSTVITSTADQEILDSVKLRWSNYLTLSEQIMASSKALNKDVAQKLVNADSRVSYDDLCVDLLELVELNTSKSSDESKDAYKIYSITFIVLIIVIIASVVIAIIISLLITKSIVNPVNKLIEVADELALGNVNVNVEANKHDEIGKLMESFGKMIENIRKQALAAQSIADGDLTIDVDVRSENDLLGIKLVEMVSNNNEILSNISTASEQVASGSRQISEASVTLSQGATEQASSIEELTASIEEISAQTNLNAENANQANKLAENVKEDAEQGNNQMKDMLNAMEEINKSSANISKIIKVIDDIAFQTNILALNAAVEAARAGQQGKGFAVVAEEVRNLAARSANAAKETTDMIENSIKKSQDGTKIAQNTANALDKIVVEVEKVANLVNEIAIASNEQASGLEQINIGIMQVSQVVQSNSATSEESAAASEELSGQAEMLMEMVGKFKLKQNASEITI